MISEPTSNERSILRIAKLSSFGKVQLEAIFERPSHENIIKSVRSMNHEIESFVYMCSLKMISKQT